MPWYYQWTIGWTDASGQWCHEVGINGAFTDHGNADYLDWINKFHLRFYNDHTAGKGDLHLWDGSKAKPYRDQLHGNGVRGQADQRQDEGTSRKDHAPETSAI